MLAGEIYRSSDPELRYDRAASFALMNRINNFPERGSEEFRSCLRELLPNCAPDISVRPPFYVDYGANIYAGKGCFFNFNCVILDVAPIRIGRKCFFAPGVQLLAATHPQDAEMRGQGLEYGGPITIGDDCWLGGGVIVLPGIAIGDRVVIGAGSVVTKDIPSDCVVAGNPAKIIRRTDGAGGKKAEE